MFRINRFCWIFNNNRIVLLTLTIVLLIIALFRDSNYIRTIEKVYNNIHHHNEDARQLVQLGGKGHHRGYNSKSSRVHHYHGSNYMIGARGAYMEEETYTKLLNKNGELSILHRRKDPRWLSSSLSKIWKKNDTNNFEKNNITETQELKPIVIYSIFAGRKSSLDIQIQYLKKLIYNNIIDEVHLWDYTCYQGGLGNHAMSQSMYLRTEILNQDSRIYIIKSKQCKWQEYYDFYGGDTHDDNNNEKTSSCRPSLLQQDDVLIKADDDILFVDTSRMKGFIETIRAFPQIYLWSANVINNGISSALHIMDGLIPTEAYYPKIEDEINCPHSKDCLYRDGSMGKKLHDYFVNDPSKFLQYPPPGKELRLIQGRMSINFVAWLGCHNTQKTLHYLKVRGPAGDFGGGHDEIAITKVASEQYQEKIIVYMPLVVAHASFNPQNIHDDAVNIYREKGMYIHDNSISIIDKNINCSFPEKLVIPTQANI